jgi:hypothetical protein
VWLTHNHETVVRVVLFELATVAIVVEADHYAVPDLIICKCDDLFRPMLSLVVI